MRAATQKDVAAKLAERRRQRARGARGAAPPAPGRLPPGARARASRPTSSSKLERLLEALEEAAADGHKALVFSQWTSLLDLVEPHLQSAGIRFTRLDGSTRDRGAVVDDFQADGGPPVMLVSLKAGGTGLNLTAADHVFLLDPWWNPAVEDQAADRAHRIGQDRPVMVYRLVAQDTVEERILALQDEEARARRRRARRRRPRRRRSRATTCSRCSTERSPRRPVEQAEARRRSIAEGSRLDRWLDARGAGENRKAGSPRWGTRSLPAEVLPRSIVSPCIGPLDIDVP